MPKVFELSKTADNASGDSAIDATVLNRRLPMQFAQIGSLGPAANILLATLMTRRLGLDAWRHPPRAPRSPRFTWSVPSRSSRRRG
jgi:hypothetical protein